MVPAADGKSLEEDHDAARARADLTRDVGKVDRSGSGLPRRALDARAPQLRGEAGLVGRQEAMVGECFKRSGWALPPRMQNGPNCLGLLSPQLSFYSNRRSDRTNRPATAASELLAPRTINTAESPRYVHARNTLVYGLTTRTWPTPTLFALSPRRPVQPERASRSDGSVTQ